MSVKRFEITDNHIKLVKQLNIIDNGGIPKIDNKRPFGNSSMYEDIDLILNGKTKEVDELIDVNEFQEFEYSEEQKAEWDKLYCELSIVLDIILYTGSFETGKYMTRTYERHWVKE